MIVPKKIMLSSALSFAVSASVVMAQNNAAPSVDLEELRRLARIEAAHEDVREKDSELPVFKSGAVGLQALNPEISVTGDMWCQHKDDETSGTKHKTFNFRGLGLHFEAYLDPYTRFKAAAPFNENGAGLGEAYFIRYGLIRNVNLMIGKFRQQFGVINRWHKHGLDQFDFPLALRQIFGPGGLNQTGVSFEWIMPNLAGASQELVLQAANGENPSVFGDNPRERPSLLARYRNYRDLSKDTYLEFGLTGLIGWNDTWALTTGGLVDDTRLTGVYGTDLTLFWEPTGRMRYRNLIWRTEGYLMNRKIQAPDGSGRDCLTAWGAYSYIQTKVSRTLEIGVRGDYYCPDSKPYALASHSVSAGAPYQWQAGPYITWWQTPFVKFHLEYNHLDVRGLGAGENLVLLQVVFAAGPHKHESY